MPGDRTEQATPHRREKARKEGDLLHSRELSAAAGTLAGVVVLGIFAAKAMEAWRVGFATFLELGAPAHWEPSEIEPTLVALRRLSLSVLGPMGAVMAAVASAALTAGVLQTGGVTFYAGAIGFRLDRINPLSNMKNLFSLRTSARLGKSLVPAALLAVFAVQRIGRQLTVPPFSTARLELLGADVYGLLLAAAGLLFAWAAVDYVVEWRSRESRLKMSREDLRQEFKETEGSPQIRSRIRGLQRQMRRRKVKADVSNAAVVLADSALGSVVTQLTQAISLATAANNGTLNSSNLESISNQIAGIRDEVTSLANTSYQGQYIFAGSQTSTVPFSISDATTPATTTYSGDNGVNYHQTPDGQTIQLNVPGDQIFDASGANSVFGALNKLVADFASGASIATSTADTLALNTALSYVSQQRVTIDNSITRLTAASDAVNSEKTQLTVAQTSLMQADLAQIATQLSLTKTQQTALEDVISQLGSGSLFEKL